MASGRALCTGDRHEKGDAAVCDRHGMHTGDAYFVASQDFVHPSFVTI